MSSGYVFVKTVKAAYNITAEGVFLHFYFLQSVKVALSILTRCKICTILSLEVQI